MPDPASPDAALLEVRGVHRAFGEVVALDDVSLDIRRNEFFALLGPSGCGKTTLLRIIAGFEAPDAGTVTLEGRDLLGVPPHRRPVNLMFQSYALFPHLTVRQNVAFGLERERLGKDEIAARVDEVLTTVGLSAQHKRRPSALSGGQRQRVALARAIVKRPQLLLLDEPLSALDKKVRAEMQLELKRLQHEVGITFVVVTHDQTEAMALADRIALLDHGRLQQVADPVTVYQRPARRFVASFIGETNLLPADDGTTLSVRPEHVRLRPPGSGRLPGSVLEVQFLGSTSTVAVQTPGRQVPVLATTTGASDLVRGQEVSIDWADENAVRLVD